MKRIIGLVLLVLSLGFIMQVYSAKADAAPPEGPSGSNIDPGGETTQVQMLAEKVVIDLSAALTNHTDIARVTADFDMYNWGEADETMQVRFPINGDPITVYTSTEVVYPVLENIRVWVDEQTVPITTSVLTDTEGMLAYDGKIYWTFFEVTFPAQQHTQIRVAYDLKPDYWNSKASYEYIMATGAGWKDAIGVGDIFLRFPYDLNAKNFGSGGRWVIDHNVAYWHFENLEPTWYDNISASFVPPHRWAELVLDETAVAENSENYSNWLELAWDYCSAAQSSAFSGVYLDDEAGVWLMEHCFQAFEKAIQLNPYEVKLRMSYIYDLERAVDDGYGEIDTTSPYYSKMVEQFKIIFAIDPQFEDARFYAEVWKIPVSIPTLPPTYTPTSTATWDPRTPFITPLPSQTLLPSLTSTPTQVPTATRTLTATREILSATLKPFTPTPTRTHTATPSATATTEADPTHTAVPLSPTATPQAAHTRGVDGLEVVLISVILIAGAALAGFYWVGKKIR